VGRGDGLHGGGEGGKREGEDREGWNGGEGKREGEGDVTTDLLAVKICG